MEQLNIVGKRSGDYGFVAHKATLVNALARGIAERVILGDNLTLGRKGFLTYLKALAGSNMVKVAPANGVDSVSHNGDKAVSYTHLTLPTN